MRIIGGRLKSRRFDAPAGQATRPTADRAKVALFNMLQGRLTGARVLDGFAGSGALSFEAISRGAASATLFEADAKAAALIGENAQRLGVGAAVDIRRADFFKGAPGLAPGGFDIIFLDPPYAAGLLGEALKTSGPLLAGGGVVVAEHAGGGLPPDGVGELARVDTRRYGAVAFSFYEKKDGS